MNSLFKVAASAAGFHLVQAVSGARIIDQWHWKRRDSRRASSTMYPTQELAWRACCERNRIDLIAALDTFTKHYLIAALWTDFDTKGKAFCLEDISGEALNSGWLDCQGFQLENKDNLAVAYEEYIDKGYAAHPDSGSPEACAGHDFWLSRNRHGTGFWDRGLTVGHALHQACKPYGEVNLYASNGRIYAD